MPVYQGALAQSSLQGVGRDYALVFWSHLPNRDVTRLTPKKLAGMAHHGWNTLKAYAKTPKLMVKVHNPKHTRHTVVDVMLPDQPFVVDTVWLHVQRAGVAIQHSVHPIWEMKADKAGRIRTLKAADGRSGVLNVAQMYLEVDRISDAGERKALAHTLTQALQDARQVVVDFEAMTNQLKALLHQAEHADVDGAAREENLAFIRWLLQNNFVFLGYRQYQVKHGKTRAQTTVQAVKGRALGVLRGKVSSLDQPTKWADLDPNLRIYFSDKSFLTVAKAIEKAMIHRHAEMDYVSIRTFDASGKVAAEHRFVGLLTSRAYTTAAQDIPIIGRKIRTILQDSGFPRTSHNFKALQNILEMFPRDELLAMELDDLQRIGIGILNLQERPQVRLFMRRNRHERQVTVMVFLPLERMNSTQRKKIQTILMEALRGESLDYAVRMGEGLLAQLVFNIRLKRGEVPDITEEELEAKVTAATMGWVDTLRQLLVHLHDPETGLRLFKTYEQQFTLGYQEQTPVTLAASDIGMLETLSVQSEGAVAFTFRQRQADAKGGEMLRPRIRIFSKGQMLPLSRVMPLLEHMGLEVCSERPYPLADRRGVPVWLHDFTLTPQPGLDCANAEDITAALYAAWQGEVEADDLAGLVVAASLNVFELKLLQGLVAYHRQAAVRVSLADIHAALLRYPAVGRCVVDYLTAKLQPRFVKREAAMGLAEKAFEAVLMDVKTLDDERLLLKLWGVAQAVLRTNAWSKTKDAPLAFKLDPAEIPDMPKPVLWREIFVCGPQVEGVHLRGGPVARGGLRWSDRLMDFRTEVLGLVKAQMTKNALIVPVGAKGGFVIKGDLPQDRGERMAAVEGAYRVFIRALLSVTDNRVGAQVVHPEKVVCVDGDDPYFVVAADKGTATFSDVANEEAIQARFWGDKIKGFWLGDAFASGGSVGYDHKGMGITARGAWESVKHHFAQMGHDTQAQDFTVVGVGDMGGDVFGNGMLLSQHIQLVGAFNHLHIFVDPTPNAATSFKERQRLFKAKYGGWDAYDTKKLSKGGRVFERSAKRLTLTPEIQQRFGLEQKEVTPDTLIQAMLRAEVDLLWNGGIGTYIKAEDESHADVADRANDALRIDGKDVRAKVIGEGGNLGVTQLGRIEAALIGCSGGGVAVNTDALDNAAGVNTSDHEVNIKVLLENLPDKQKLSAQARDALLVKMTDSVADLVLEDNRAQAEAVTLKARQGTKNIETTWRLQQGLVKRGLLDAAVEFLPDEEVLEERQRKHVGYTRPELCVLLSYAKMDVYAELLAGDVPDAACLRPLLGQYFPGELAKYTAAMPQHPLARHIVATVLTNRLVNRMGLTFLHRVREETGHRTEDVVRAWVLMSLLLDVDGWWVMIEAQTGKVAAEVVIEMQEVLKGVLEFGTYWALQYLPQPLDLEAERAVLAPLFDEAMEALHQTLPVDETWQQRGLKAAEAQAMVTLEHMVMVPDVVRLAQKTSKADVAQVFKIYQDIGGILRLPELYARVREIPVSTTWQRVATRTLVREFYEQHARLVKQVMRQRGGLAAWEKRCNGRLALYLQQVQEVFEHEAPTHAMFVAVLGQVKSL